MTKKLTNEEDFFQDLKKWLKEGKQLDVFTLSEIAKEKYWAEVRPIDIERFIENEKGKKNS